MKNKKRSRYHLRISVLVPFIFTGLSVLAVLGTYRISELYMKSGEEPVGPLWLWGLAIGCFTMLSGILVIWMILKPIKKFMKEVEQNLSVMPQMAGADRRSPGNGRGDEMELFTQVAEQVTHLLSKLEATELFPNIIGQSRAMRGLFHQILKAAPTDATVLISGESGTGKELVATSIYEHSLRKGKPFVKINCVAIPEGLLESELFGHEKGAFTGATAMKPGKFELANGGTILLDEIGDMPAVTQGKLLRVLQERELERVGGTRPIRIDVRIIASTNKNLEKMVKEGRFREDLYYRLNVISLHLPPLRERKEDIPSLALHFLGQLPNTAELSPAALELLVAWSWPGNIRELQNTLERAAVMAGELIQPEHLPTPVRLRGNQVGLVEDLPDAGDVRCIDDRLRMIEKGMIIEALKKTGGVQARAAELLGINQRSLWHRVKKYDIDTGSLKNQASEESTKFVA